MFKVQVTKTNKSFNQFSRSSRWLKKFKQRCHY